MAKRAVPQGAALFLLSAQCGSGAHHAAVCLADDHGYYFIQTFIDNHLQHHAKGLDAGA